MARVIGIISGKGGVGKTTLTANLGASLAHFFKKNVTVIDCNITTSHLGLYLGIHFCPTSLNKVLRNEISIEEALYKHYSGANIVPASLSWKDLEGVDVIQIKDSIKKLFDKTDIILLDAAPGLGREALAAIRACDEVIFVTTPYVPCVMDVVRCLEVVNEVGVKPIGIVLNMVGNERYEMKKKEIEQLTGLPVIASIPLDKNVLRSLALRTPVVLFNQKSKASKEIIKLAGSLIGETYKSESFFSRIFKKLRL
ncbi:MAG: cell division ATPase MinD [Candidatus Aenigmarchaeota archaeon]|nr:cell division ATPase MinD [Candidatus Aenigmarchaeota archaeon]